MHWLLVVLRLVHIVFGVVWVGMMTFTVFFLIPAIAEAGPEGGKVMAALQRRRILTVMPITALLTIASGIWLMLRVYGGMGGLLASRMGVTLNVGATAALLAFILGIALMRPAMARAAALAQDPAANKDEIQRLRARGAAVGRVVALLLLLAAGAMAAARYV